MLINDINMWIIYIFLLHQLSAVSLFNKSATSAVTVLLIIHLPHSIKFCTDTYSSILLAHTIFKLTQAHFNDTDVKIDACAFWIYRTQSHLWLYPCFWSVFQCRDFLLSLHPQHGLVRELPQLSSVWACSLLCWLKLHKGLWLITMTFQWFSKQIKSSGWASWGLETPAQSHSQ